MRMQLKYVQETLAFISENAYEVNHVKFLKSTAVFLAELFNVNCVLIDKYSSKNPTVAETAVIFFKGNFLPNITYKLENTPCENVINNKVCSYTANVKSLFPKDELLAQMNIESYIGIPLWSSKKEPRGLIALMDDKPIVEEKNIETILGIIAIKIEEILEKMLFEHQLNLKIEEINKAKEKAEKSEEKLKTLSNLTFEGILIHEMGVAIDFNNSFLKMFGYSNEDLVGKNITKIIYPKKYHKTIAKNRINNYTFPYEVEGIRKDGSVFPVEIEAKNIILKNNKTLRVTAFRDITGRKKSEAENKKLSIAIEQSANTVLITDIYGNIEYTNPKFTQVTGYTAAEVLGRNPRILKSGEQPEEFYKRLWQTISAGNIWKGQMKNKTKSGKFYWEQVTITPIKDEAGKIISYLAIKEDITNRKESEQQLQKQNKKYKILSEDYLNQNSALKQLSNELSEKNRLLLESKDRFINLFEQSPVPLWEQDFSAVIKLLNEKKTETTSLEKYLDENPNFVEECVSNIKILNINKAARALFSVKNVEELKMHLRKTNNKKALEVLKKELVSIGSNKKSFSHETELIGKDGSLIMAIIKSVIIDNYGTSVASVIDITAAKKIEQELLNAKEKAEESGRLKTEFIQNMSHEIRTPMNGILGFSELLDNPNLSNEKRKLFIDIIKNSTHQLLHIIDDIMEISVLETKQIMAEENPVCLNDILRELFTIFNIKATKKNTKLVLKNELSDQESMILTDKNKLNKVLGNLLENALKFTDEGFVELGYKINKESEAADLEIYVKDSGIGIKPEKQKIIFDRFSQAEKDLSKNVGGLGLGLSIAKENAELLGGKISVVSDLGEGAAFFVIIPYKPVNLIPKIEKEKEKISGDKKKHTILIAEDEEVNFMVLEILLVDKIKLPCTIIHANDGLEAVELFKANPDIELVLMDIKMPKMDGHEAAKRIKEFRPNIPIIAQTAYSTPEEKEKAFLAGCDDFISKPISKDVLNSVIGKYLLDDKK